VDRLLTFAKRQASGNGREFEDAIHKWVESERAAGRPDSYISTNWHAVRSFLKHEESAPAWTPKLKVQFGTTIVTEVVPTPEQLRSVLDRTSPHRTRSIILILATSGMRLGVLGSRFDPPNGLRLESLPDLKLGGKDGPHFDRTPFRIDVPAALSKGGQPYFTFATEEAATEYLAYLQERIARGEKLTPKSALFSPEPKASHVHRRPAADGTSFLNEKAIAGEIRHAFRRVQPAGVRWRPYVTRAFTSSQLMVSEGSGLIHRDAREFLMGHTSDVGRKYNLGKGRVRSDLEEDVREQYARAADRFLRILTISERAVDYRPILRVLLAGAGYTKAEVDAMGDLTEERVIEAIRAKRTVGVDVPSPKQGDNARTVAVSELDLYLSKGWKPIAPAGSERFVVGAPN
jgi:hypothetical protein